ncbi:hypothetical protein [Parasitella parasitica]|uniref:RNase III domain-containing protein n=1 Tax=Parasitella parasitica TaxID=35722 RepID=A0A0B7NLR2_9FUNG|nr:hypothetical protein [Parasitella parasitica]
MTDTDKLEQYINDTFSKIIDAQGRPLDVSLALPTLKQILTGYYQEIVSSKFDFIGESALQFAINLILVQRYSKYDNRILSLLAKKFRAPLQLYKQIGKQIQLNQYVRPTYLKEKMEMILGVLYYFYGIAAVQKFIEEAFVFFVENELNNASSPKKAKAPNSSDNNPVQTLYEMVKAGNGIVEISYLDTPDKKWQVNIIARLNEKSLLFSHARASGSKQKAKNEASRDILAFFANNPDVRRQLEISGDGNAETHALPISENDYCHLFDESTSIVNSRRALKTGDWDGENNCTHLTQDGHEEATLLLEKLLLSNNMDVDVDARQVKRQRQVPGTSVGTSNIANGTHPPSEKLAS